MAIKKIQFEYPDLDKYIKEYDENKNEDEDEYGDEDEYIYEHEDGDIFYCKKDTDIWHNPYGPVYVGTNGYVSYMINNEFHRLDGPAIIRSDNSKQYCINGNALGNSKEEFYNNIKNLDSKPINKQDKINVLNIKNSILLGLDSEGVNILKLLL